MLYLVKMAASLSPWGSWGHAPRSSWLYIFCPCYCQRRFPENKNRLKHKKLVCQKLDSWHCVVAKRLTCKPGLSLFNSRICHEFKSWPQADDSFQAFSNLRMLNYLDLKREAFCTLREPETNAKYQIRVWIFLGRVAKLSCLTSPQTVMTKFKWSRPFVILLQAEQKGGFTETENYFIHKAL